MAGVDAAHVPYLWLARVMILGMGAFLIWGVRYAWRTHPKFFEDTEREEPTP